MEKSTKKVLVVAGVTITLGTGGYIGYKVIKNKRNRAEQARCFNADNDILHSLNEIKDAEMYKKFCKIYLERSSELSNANSDRKFREALARLDELDNEIEDYLYEQANENPDNKEVTDKSRVTKFIIKTFDNHDQSDVIKKNIEKGSEYPNDIKDLVSEKDYNIIGNIICEALVKEYDIDIEYLDQNPVVSSLIKLYLIKCKKKGLFEEEEKNDTKEEKEVRKGKKNKKNKKKDKNKKEVKEETKDEDQEEEMNTNEEKVVKEESSDEDETIKETNEEEAVTDDKENEEESNTKEEKEVRKDKKKKNKKNKKNKKEVKEETSDEDETVKETNEENKEEKNDTKEEKEVKEEIKDKDQEEAVTNDEENEEEKNDTKEEKEVRKNKKNKKDKRNKKKANKVEKEKCERDQEAVATDDEEKEVRKDRKKDKKRNKKRNKNKKMTKDESFKEKDNNENEEGECHNEVSNTTDEENCDDERFDEGLVKDICGVKVDFTDDDEDDEEDEYVEKDNLKKLLFNSMDEDDEDEDVENNVEPEIVECPTEADFEDSPRTAYFDMIEYRKDILNSTTYNIKERFHDFNDSIQILNTKEHYGYYHECLEVIFSILSMDEPEEHTLTRLDTFFKEFDRMVKPVIEKRIKDITTIAR